MLGRWFLLRRVSYGVENDWVFSSVTIYAVLDQGIVSRTSSLLRGGIK
jgi:hypothetical protein